MIINHSNYGTHYGPDIHANVGEINLLPSLTVPEQSLPLRVLLERYVRGGDVVVYPGVYSEDVPAGMENLTEIERIDAARDLKAAISRSQTRIRPEPQPEPEPEPQPEPQPEPKHEKEAQ